jgi:hypothetical protein
MAVASARESKAPAGRPRPAPGAGPNAAAEAAERLKAIVRNATTPEDALEPSLRWIVEASGGAAGAICFFDQRKEVLRLAAECNLSDEGCKRLRSVRRGDVSGWDMPLHGLLNRRAYLIDSAAKNRYVPPLIDPPAQVRSIVCLPLYQGNTALGSLLIIATGARVLMERDIRNLEPSLRELSTLIEEIRLRAPTLAPSRPATVTPITTGPTAPGEGRPRAVPGSIEPESASGVLMEVLELRAKVQELRGQIATGDAATEEERDRGTELARKLQEASAALKKAQATERTLNDELLAARRDLPTRLAELEARAEEQARRAADLEAKLVAAGKQREADVAALKSRLAGAEAGAATERARAEEAARKADEAGRKADEATAGAREYGEAELAAARAVVDGLKAELAEKRKELERLEPIAHAAESLERDLRATREREMALRTSTAALEAEVTRLRAAAGGAESPAMTPAAAAEPKLAEPRLAVVRPVEAQPAEAPPAEVKPVEQQAAEPTPAEPKAAPAPAAQVSGQGTSRIVVVDTGGAWARLGERVQVEAPDEQLAQRLDAVDGRLLVNLAAPGALHALARLRAAGSTRRFWGCIATSDAARALPLGMVEPAQRPLAPEALVELLNGYANRGTRVVTLGRDIDAFGGFRQSMAKQGLSVSMAWDAKQAADVIAMVRPEVAVVDLESLREGCAIIAGLAGAEPLPHLILLLGAKDASPGFAHAVRDPAHAARALPLDRLVAELARRSESRPAERR